MAKKAKKQVSTANVRELRAVIREALEPGVFGPWHTTVDPQFRPEIEALCNQCGYGALMHHVEALWKKRNIERGYEGAEHTCAAAASVRRQWIERAQKALKK